MKRLEVNTFNKYSIVIDNSFNSFCENASPLMRGKNVAVVLDSNIDKLYGNFLNSYLKDKNIFKYVIKAGEKSKNSKNYVKILNKMVKDGFSRDDTIITFGGGVVGDLGGFIASTFMRGICLITIPTSLLSMVDSSVGGKTAINLNYGKNLCGTFYQPSLVYINIKFLETLSIIELQNGLGEVIKYAYISKSISFNDTENIDYENLVYKCLEIKKNIVEQDEMENYQRKLLNFGHTFGHAIERLSKFKLSHGLCVVKGIYFALKVSKKYYNQDSSLLENFIEEAKKLSFDLSCSFSVNQLIKEILNDKKRNANGIDLVLCENLGNLKIENINIEDIEEYL